ncbi:hypothetical protein PVAP13_5NG315400 [Panicum virgatum]|uniref:Uncharacterized protein n=1 Tax=Panicum virgatum TaxID=38727 RepID=A0A8T0RZH5_PANVG|nr:hypothetical protein PVAP13_5NG315400 [Panicum virgatum]
MRLGSPTSTRYTTYRFKKIEPDCCPLLLCRPFSPCFLSRYRPNPRSALQVSSPPLSYGMDPRDNALPSSIVTSAPSLRGRAPFIPLVLVMGKK